MPKTDALGRATFDHIKPLSGVRPTERELRWLQHLSIHGPQPSYLLYELTRDTHRCRDTALRDLKKLRAGGYLHLPAQQRQTAKADFKPYIYDRTAMAERHLRALGLVESAVRPTGHWWHAYQVALFTGSLAITAREHGKTYIPAHTILGLKDRPLPIPLKRGKLIPDQLFALRGSEGYRAYFVEVDRSTEPVVSCTARRSLARIVEDYLEVFDRQLSSEHYGLKAPVMILFVCNTPKRVERLLELIHDRAERFSERFIIKYWPQEIADWPRLLEWQASGWCRSKRSQHKLFV